MEERGPITAHIEGLEAHIRGMYDELVRESLISKIEKVLYARQRENPRAPRQKKDRPIFWRNDFTKTTSSHLLLLALALSAGSEDPQRRIVVGQTRPLLLSFQTHARDKQHDELV